MEKKLLNIHQPQVIQNNGKSRLSAVLEFGSDKKNLWLEVDKAYEKYLCFERSDAFLIAVLPYIMRKGYDVTCCAPVTSEILYSLERHLIPTLCKSEKGFHYPKIIAECTDEPLINHEGVGTGISCGVDSFHSVANHVNPPNGYPRLTHLCVFNHGSFEIDCYEEYGTERVKLETFEKANQIAGLLGLPLIIADSNIHKILFFEPPPGESYFGEVFTYNIGFCVLAMQKLWKTYLFPSGYEYLHFSIDHRDTSSYDLLSLNCFSTRQLRFFSEGAPFNRAEKLSVVSEFSIARKYLHVCFCKGYNCGTCTKCRRTLLAMDTIGKLDAFREIMPVDYYKANLTDYLTWLVKSVLNNTVPSVPVYESLMEKGIYTDRLNAVTDKLKSGSPVSDMNGIESVCANCICIMDADIGEVIFNKNANKMEKPGHISAVLACLVALEQGNLDDIFVLPNVTKFSNITVMDYSANEKMTLLDMLYGMMLPSYTNIAEAMAICLSGSVAAFADEMNKLAKRIGMVSSCFSSPHCATNINDKTTAHDMALAAKYALNNPIFKKIISTPVYNAKTSLKEYEFKTTNALLLHANKSFPDMTYPFCTGGKTGKIDGRYNFISIAEKKERKHIAVQLGISNVFGFDGDWAQCFTDAALLHEWAFAQSG